tara:strand:+ start:966 stop:1196 length:231 start_codon:yes stop_codon:yes gene_type:complete
MVTTVKNKENSLVRQGDLVKVKYFAGVSANIYHGVVVSKKFDNENTMFPCIDVYVFGLNDKHRCMSHQLEILSSAS